MDAHAQQNPLFHALDIILAYLNHGNSLPEIKVLASDAEAWCQHHHHHLLPDPNTLPNPENNRNTRPLPLPTQHFFSAILDAYTLSVGGGGSEKSKRPSSSSSSSSHDHHDVVVVVVAQDLKASPIIYYMPEVVRRIAALDARDLLTTQFSTFSPKTSLGFSCYLGKNKGFDVVMMDAPPPPPVVCPGEGDSRVEFMDVDDDAGPSAAANANRQRLRQTPKLQSQHPDKTRVNKRSPKRTPGPQGTKRWPSGRSRGKQSRGRRKRRKKRHE